MATPKGSNDLNMILKAKVVQIKIELDYKGSKLPSQIKEISKWLKDNNHHVKLQVELDKTGSRLVTQVNDITKILKEKPVKLNVELNAKNNELASQVKLITKALENKPVQAKIELVGKASELNAQIKKMMTGMALKPIKVGVQIDVVGSVKAIKQELKDVNNIIQDFNNKLMSTWKSIKFIQSKIPQSPLPTPKQNPNNPNPNPAPTNAPVGGGGYQNYIQQLRQAEAELRRLHGKKGLFGSHEIKDANGSLQGFIATLTKANGVVQKIQYQWDADASAFTPVKQETVTNTQKHVKQAIDSLRELDREIFKISNKHQKGFWHEYNNLALQGQQGTLTQDAVNDLKRRIKDEQVIEQILKKENDELLEQKKLIHEIRRARDKDWNKNQDPARRKQYNDVLNNVANNPKDLKEQRFELKKINEASSDRNRIDKEHIENTKKRMKVMQELRKLDNSTLSYDKNSRILLNDARFLTQRAKSAQEWLEIEKKINAVKTGNAKEAVQQKALDLQVKTQTRLNQLRKQSIITEAEYQKYIKDLPSIATRSLADLEKFYANMNRMYKVEKEDKKIAEDARRVKIDPNTNAVEATKFKSLVDNKDIVGLEQYIGKLYKGQVETLKIKNTTDDYGRSVAQLDVRMKGHGKTIQTYTVQMERANGTLREVAHGTDYNANRNLGVFEQLKIAMARVPVWMTAMTAFYGTIRSVRAMSNEILTVDKAITELKRVASSNISISTLFDGAVNLSGELGNNIHDIMQSMNDFARTFGDFNERQLLAITKTATLMSNVSDLSAQEATESLVGTMNAFNIEAEESIRIVDALNEVDNNYAVSTKQLATGLAKSASTAKTFGVSLEENVGHITAISSVTMESGNIIGNSLKTIYSRMTTLNSSIDILEKVGVAVHDVEGNVRPVNDILGDLANRWYDLSDSQRQNIAVQVAGRYQLSRFLALMNNYEIAQNATNTAVYSHGSAMRENEQYMKSFEARINKLKNSFTEMSLAIGDRVLSDGMLVLIEFLKTLATGATSLVSSFGALPPVLLAVFLLLNKMNFFDSIKTSIKGAGEQVQIFRKAYAETMTTAGSTATKQQAIASGFRAIAVAEGQASAGAKAFGFSLRSALISTGVGAIVVALGMAIEWMVKKLADQKRKAEELEKINKQMIQSYRESGDGLKSLTERYTELSNKSQLSADEQEEFNKLQADLAKAMPTVIDFIDANGKAHFRNAEAIEYERKQLEKLSKEKAKQQDMKYEENMSKKAESYSKVLKKITDLEEKRQGLIDSHGTVGKKYYDTNTHDWATPDAVDNSKAIQQANIDMIILQNEQTEAIKKTIKAISDQSLAHLEAEGKMSGLGDAQKKLIENFIQYNDAYLRTAKTEEEALARMETLYDVGTRVGETLNTIYTTLTKGIDNPLELDKIKSQLDTIAKVLPESFFKVDENRTALNIVNDLNKIYAITQKVVDGGDDWYGLIKRLQEAGFSYDDARGYLARLAREHDNAKLRAMAQSEGVEELTGSIEDLNKETFEAIDLTKTLFGYSSGDLSAIKSHIQAMTLLVDAHGEAGKNTKEYMDSVSALSDFFRITQSELEANIDNYFGIVDALQQVDLATYDVADSFDKFIDKQENLSKSQKEMLKEWAKTGQGKDIITGAVSEVGKSYDDLNTKVEKVIKKTKGQELRDMALKTEGAFNAPIKLEVQGADEGIQSIEDLKKKTQELTDVVETSETKVNEISSNIKKNIEENTKNLKKASDSKIEVIRKEVTEIDKLGRAYEKIANLSRFNYNQKIDVPNDSVKINSGTSSSFEGYTGFVSLSGESGGESGGGDGGTSGTLIAPKSTFIGTRTLNGGYDFHALATKIETKYAEDLRTGKGDKDKKDDKKKSGTKKNTEETKENTKAKLEQLKVINWLEVRTDALSTSISIQDSKMRSLNKNTKEYRDALETVISLSNKKLSVQKQDLANTIARNAEIEKEKKKLGNTSSHKEEQRNKYNELTSEFEQNLSKINSLKTEIASATQDIKEKSFEIFTDFVGQVVSKWDASINAVKRRIDDIDFSIQVAELKNPDDKKGILKLQKNKETWLVEERARAIKKMNELQAEYDKAVKKHGDKSKEAKAVRDELWNAQEAFEDATIAVLQAQADIKQRAFEIFSDSVDKFTSKFDKAIDHIDWKIDNIDFKIDVIKLTNPEDTQALLNAQIEKATELGGKRAEQQRKVNGLEARYSDAVKRYGANSKEAEKIKNELSKAKEELEDIVLSVLTAEKEIKDIRASVADEAIKALKDYYGNMKQMATDAIDAEIKHLEEAHKKKMEMYDKDIKKINDVYDAKFKKMDEDKARENYEEGLAEKTAKKNELMSKIALLSRDNTKEGKKKLAELQKQLEEVNKDIKDFQEKRADEVLRADLENQKEAQVKAIENKKETEEANHKIKIETLEKEKEEVIKHYDDLINNDRKWAEMRNQAIKGNFTLIQKELGSMDTTLQNMNKGIFNDLTKGFANFSEEVKRQIAEVNKLIIDNMIFNSGSPMSGVNGASNANSYTPANPSGNSGNTVQKKGRLTTGSFKNGLDASSLADILQIDYDAKNPQLVQDGSGGYKVVADFESKERAEKVLEKLKLRKLLSTGHISEFKTGGYTGDDLPDSGALAVVHKKELILNENQTSDILDTAKIMDKIRGVIPALKRIKMAKDFAMAGGVNISNTYGDIYVTVENGDKKKAQDIAKEILTGMRKRGK